MQQEGRIINQHVGVVDRIKQKEFRVLSGTCCFVWVSFGCVHKCYLKDIVIGAGVNVSDFEYEFKGISVNYRDVHVYQV